MPTKQRTEIRCARRGVLTETPIADPPDTAQATAEGCDCRICAQESHHLSRLRYWIAGRLLHYGAQDAVVDQKIADIPLDVVWRLGSRQCAVRISTGPLVAQAVNATTERLRELGIDQVLWLCAPGFWVAQTPALGIGDWDPEDCDYQVVSGVLTLGERGLCQPRTEPDELREFLRHWVGGQMVWGYRDDMTKGWAMVTDWQQHTKTQALLLSQQRQELVTQRTALALSRKSVREKTKQLMRLTARLERTEEFAQEQADALAVVQRKLDDHHRLDAALRDNIRRLHGTVNHWQLITIFVMMLLVTFMAAALVLH